jgi:HEAT repeat protein
MRLQAARALGRIADARALEPLFDALGDGDPDVRAAAAEALHALTQV